FRCKFVEVESLLQSSQNLEITGVLLPCGFVFRPRELIQSITERRAQIPVRATELRSALSFLFLDDLVEPALDIIVELHSRVEDHTESIGSSNLLARLIAV